MKELTKTQTLDVQAICGLPIHNYFSAVKLKWLIDQVPKVSKAVEKKRAMFGTVDTWLIWVSDFFLKKKILSQDL